MKWSIYFYLCPIYIAYIFHSYLLFDLGYFCVKKIGYNDNNNPRA